jgi:asparagine synthase (glutamine-hydrolysing)
VRAALLAGASRILLVEPGFDWRGGEGNRVCGIIGVFGRREDSLARVEAHLGQLRHRGPDFQQAVAGDDFVFGHTLLSIIGASPIRQPITSSDGRLTVSYNGEIYNYLELLDADPELRRRCTVRSDTQVLVEGLALHGFDFLAELNGIFAFAGFDRQRGTGFLVRDRLGVKPVYYAQVGDQVFFASELRPLMSLSGAATEPDEEGWYSYARFRYPLGERSYYRGARIVPPGTLLTVRDGTVSASTWWTIREPEPFAGSYEEAREQARALLQDAVRIQMRSDHSFCTYLSGGLDSSYLTAVAAQQKERLDTYSIGVTVPELDESAHARRVAECLGTVHHPYLLGEAEYRERHAALVRHLGTPVSVPNQVALEVLSRELSRDHRCVLSGEGADEVFGGYGRIFLLPVDWERMQSAAPEDAALKGEVRRRVAERDGRADYSDYAAFFLRRYGYLTHEESVSVLAPYFSAKALGAARDAVEGEIRSAFAGWRCDLQARQLLLFQRIHLPGLLLRVDAATMAHGVEARVPFLDHRLLEFLNGLPISYKMRRKQGFDAAMRQGLLSDELSEVEDVPKAPLKEIAEDVLDKETIWRRKVGFPIPSRFFAPEGGSPSASPPYVQWVERNLALASGALR